MRPNKKKEKRQTPNEAYREGFKRGQELGMVAGRKELIDEIRELLGIVDCPHVNDED